MEDNIITIEQYLKGKVRNIDIPDNALSAIIMDAGCTTIPVKTVIEETDDNGIKFTVESSYDETVTKDSAVTLLSMKERELCLAWLYVWIAGSPTQSGGYTEEDADWKSSENGERMSASVLKTYLNRANAIFEKYGLETVSTNKWGFVGRGFHAIRRYQRPSR